jgi:hypothetical protein
VAGRSIPHRVRGEAWATTSVTFPDEEKYLTDPLALADSDVVAEI